MYICISTYIIIYNCRSNWWRDYWSAGWRDYWYVGWRDYWYVGWRDYWYVGWRDYWSVGSRGYWSVGWRDYQSDRTTAVTNLVGYSNDFFPITSCLTFLGTIPNWCNVTDIMFVCFSEFGVLRASLISCKSAMCSLMCSSNL